MRCTMHVCSVVAGNTVESLSEIYEVSEVLEGFAAQLAAHYARPSDLVSCALTLFSVAMKGACFIITQSYG